MFEVKDLVNEVVKEENENREREIKERVKTLIKIVIDCQNNIERSNSKMMDAKKELQELSGPTEFKFEVNNGN